MSKAKAKRKGTPAKAGEEPTPEALRYWLEAAITGKKKAAWMRRLLMDCGYLRKSNRATKSHMRRFGNACRGVLATCCKCVAEYDPELAKELQEQVKSDMAELDSKHGLR